MKENVILAAYLVGVVFAFQLTRRESKIKKGEWTAKDRFFLIGISLLSWVGVFGLMLTMVVDADDE